jgi:uncharacterized membrane protein
MTVVLVILGLVLGSALYGFPGAVAGAALGYAIGELIDVRERLRTLEREVSELRLSRERPSGAAEICEALTESAVAETCSSQNDADTISPEATFSFEEFAEKPEFGIEHDENLIREDIRETVSDHEKKPSRGTPIADLFNRFFSGGSLLVKAGIVILFFGVSFLVKYAAEHELLPIELRLAAAGAGAVLLLVIGWRLRYSRDIYAQVLQGGGVGILYLTTFAAFRLYSLIPPPLAFFVLVSVAVLSAVLAVLQNACSLAVIGVSGGFLAPVLTSTGAGSHVFLFSYYALLNGGIIGIAWFRAWRILNLLGFFFTFIIGAAWGFSYYQPGYFASTEPFLILFFIMYLFIAILFALRREPDLKGYLDGTLVFGTPIVAFALQAMLVRHYPYGLAWSSLGLGLLYMPLAWVLYLKKPAYMRTLIEAFFAFGVVFATLTIPLALDNRWTSAAWALEGAGILWAGLRQNTRLARAFAFLLLFGAGVFFLIDAGAPAGGLPILNGYFTGCVLLALSGLFSSFCLYRHGEITAQWERYAGIALFIWGLLWWFSGGLNEIDMRMPHDYRMGIILVFFVISCGALEYLAKKLSWPWGVPPALCLLPLLCLTALTMVKSGLHPASEGGFIAWPLAFAAYYAILYRREETPADDIRKILHAGTFWLITVILSLEMHWQADNLVNGAQTWSDSIWGLVPSLLVLLLAAKGGRLKWPVNEYNECYLSLGAGPVMFAAWLWTVYANLTSPGDSDPLGWLPLVNPLDIMTGFVFAVLAFWFKSLLYRFPGNPLARLPKLSACIFAASLFLWVNAILVRAIHHWGGVEFSLFPLFESVLLQASFSIFWSLLALCVMVIATRRGFRRVWLTGAGLLFIVVVKLFLVDLSNSGTVERIVSFVGVGILLLVIGYFSPVPPRGSKVNLK